jgi:uncharacterized protein (TIGR02284 family)
MYTTDEKVTTALQELIIINNDRTEGYKKAAAETKDPDLKELFTKYAMQSLQFGSELRRFSNINAMPERDDTKLSGKFYRIWMDVKAALTGNDRKAILSSCEYGEDVALKSYKDVLEDNADLPQEVLTVIQNQKAELQEAHDRVRFMRDSSK